MRNGNGSCRQWDAHVWDSFRNGISIYHTIWSSQNLSELTGQGRVEQAGLHLKAVAYIESFEDKALIHFLADINCCRKNNSSVEAFG